MENKTYTITLTEEELKSLWLNDNILGTETFPEFTSRRTSSPPLGELREKFYKLLNESTNIGMYDANLIFDFFSPHLSSAKTVEDWEEVSTKLAQYCDEMDFKIKPLCTVMPFIFDWLKQTYTLHSAISKEEDRWICETKPEIGIDKNHPYTSLLILLSNCKEVFSGFYEMGKFIDVNGNEVKNIKFWQPLPCPPKKKEGDNEIR